MNENNLLTKEELRSLLRQMGSLVGLVEMVGGADELFLAYLRSGFEATGARDR